MRKLVICAALLTQGCATVTSVVESPAIMVTCQAADTMWRLKLFSYISCGKTGTMKSKEQKAINAKNTQ